MPARVRIDYPTVRELIDILVRISGGDPEHRICFCVGNNCRLTLVGAIPDVDEEKPTALWIEEIAPPEDAG